MTPSFARVFRCLLLTAVAFLAAGAATQASAQDLIAGMTQQTSIQFLKEFADFQEIAPQGNTGVAFKYQRFTIVLAVHAEPYGWTLATTFPDSVPLEKLNEWNRDTRYAKAYRNADGGTTLEFDIDFAGGVTRAHLHDWVRTYVIQLEHFAERLAQAPKG